MGFANPLELLKGASNDLPPFIRTVFENSRENYGSTLEAIGAAIMELKAAGWTVGSQSARPPPDLVERILEHTPNASPDMVGSKTIPEACALYVWCHQERLLSGHLTTRV